MYWACYREENDLFPIGNKDDVLLLLEECVAEAQRFATLELKEKQRKGSRCVRSEGNDNDDNKDRDDQDLIEINRLNKKGKRNNNIYYI